MHASSTHVFFLINHVPRVQRHGFTLAKGPSQFIKFKNTEETTNMDIFGWETTNSFSCVRTW
jgi:hypothetical protein